MGADCILPPEQIHKGADLTYALRSLLRRPGYTATAVLVLAAAIGAATAVFTLVDAVLIRPLPMADQGRLVVLWASEPEHPLVEISYPDFEDYRAQSRALVNAAAHGSSAWPTLLTGAGDPVRLPFAAVSGSFFEVLGAEALVGRALSPADEQPGATRVAVLSYPLWQQRFAGDPAIVGRRITLDGEPHVVVGIMPPRFDYPAGSQLWAPLKHTIDSLARAARENLRAIGFLYVVGRLAPGVTMAQAVDDGNAIFRRQFDRYRVWDQERRAQVTPLVVHVLGPTRPALLLLAIAGGLVLLLGCVNVAGLALVRAASRRQEIAMRYALGASRGDVLALLLAEAGLVCGAALLLALPIAAVSLRLFGAAAPAAAAVVRDAPMGLRSIAFATAAALAAAAFAALHPLTTVAINSARRKPFDRSDLGRSFRTGFGRQLIIGAQVAVTVTVLTAAGLAARSFLNMQALDLGFTPQRVLLVDANSSNPTGVRNALSGLPGVQSVGAVSLKPLTLGPIGDDAAFQREDQSPGDARQNPALNRLEVTPGYFDAMGIRLIAGRRFEERDAMAGAPLVAIVSDATARAIWGHTNVLGKKVRIARLEPDSPYSTVVGVVRPVRHRQIHETKLDFYVPTTGATTWAVRTTGDPAALAAAAREAVRRIDPAVAIETTPLSSLVATAQRPWRFTAFVLTAFAALALMLAATGVHGVVAYAVSLRMDEFGIRAALGASPRDIVWLVCRSFGAVALAGLAIGVPASLAAARLMRGVLFGVSPADATSVAAAIASLAVALALACLVPGRRAALVDPAQTLRG